MRYFDVVDKSAPNKNAWIYYEFKSVAKVPPAHFAEQFLKDLQNANSLDQIKWIFDGKKNPIGTKQGQSFKKAMEDAIEGLKLDDTIAQKLLKNSKATADDLKDVLKSRSKEIFLIVK